jgi:hypothetical protein
MERADAAPPAGEPADVEREGRRRRRRGERGERGEGRAAGGAPAPTTSPSSAASKITETIDTSDGREFWEAWIDSKSDAPASAEASGATTTAQPISSDDNGAETRERGDRDRGERGRRRNGRNRGERGERGAEPTPLAPGQVRLYLNVGRRDGVSDDEIKSFIDGKGISYAALDIRSSHTYVIADESNENAILTALNGAILGTRDLVCERARR